MRHVIIGNGGASLSAIRSIRAKDRNSSITVISNEELNAYSPVLTTYYIAGRIPRSGLFVVDHQFYEEHGVKTILGSPAVAIDTALQHVVLDNNQTVPYDTLLIATGGTPDAIDNIDDDVRPFVATLRTISDAEKIIALSGDARRIIIVGAGLVSLQSLNAVYKPGVEITVLVTSRQLLSQNVDAEAAEIVMEKISAQSGIRIIFGASVSHIERKGNGAVLTLMSGEQLGADLVIVGKGITANTQLTDGSDIQVDKAILVDDYLRTNIPNVFAAGDVCEGKNRLTGTISPVPNWINAREQGRAAGFNMCGCQFEFPGSVQENVTKLFGTVIASIGKVNNLSEDTTVLTHRDARRSIYRKCMIAPNGRMIGALLVNTATQDIGVVRDMIVRGADIEGLEGALARGPVDVARSCLPW
jgi:NAD(P)H-nitrite reductase large subunit